MTGKIGSLKNIRLCGVLITALTTATIIPSAVYADEEVDALFDLDIEDLIVSVASKKNELINDAPSVVSVITADDIKRYGANNLLDVLKRAPSVQVIGDGVVRQSVVSIRAQGLQHTNSHILYLLNGRPMRDSHVGAFVDGFINNMPVSMIKKIEIIRGPGSVLYGTSAYSGVINIKTKSASDLKNASVSATYGSFHSRTIEGSFGQSVEGIDIAAGGKSFNSNGYDYKATDTAGVTSSFEADNHDYGHVATLNYKDLTINSFYGKTKGRRFGIRNLFLDPGNVNKQQSNALVDIGYNHKFSDDWQVSYNLGYTNMSNEKKSLDNDNFLNEITVRGALSDNLDIIFGGTNEMHESHLKTGEIWWTRWWSSYGQAEYRPLDWLKLVAGIQMNKPDNVKKDFSPRFAAVMNLNKNWGAKLLYGEAFRSAHFAETSYDASFLIGNPDLSPEKIATSEAQIFYHNNKYDASLTYFHSEMEDIITRIGFGPATFNNSGELTYDGLELEGKARLNHNWSIDGNIFYQKNKDENGVSGTMFFPSLMAKAGVSYDSNEGYRFGIYDSFFGEPVQLSKFNSTIAEDNPKAAAFHLVTLNASFDINKIFDKYSMPDTTVSFFIDNALDEDIRFPDIGRQNINSLPVHSGRAFYGTVKFKF